jgi:prepilin-type N-terminal cleavage/methylation domain-containing protein
MAVRSPHRGSHDQRGITLLELVISMSVFLVILLGIYLIFDVHHKIFASGESRADVQFNARYTMGQMARQIRMTGYFPENFATPPAVPASTNALQIATDSALAIRGDADGSGASNVFLFCLNAGSLIRVKAPVGTAAAYTCAGGQILGRNIASLAFAYFGDNNTPIPNPPTPPYQLDGDALDGSTDFTNTAQRAAVRRVVITFTSSENVPGQQAQTYTLTSDLRLRNIN